MRANFLRPRRPVGLLAAVSAFALAILMSVAGSAPSVAGEANFTPIGSLLLHADWQDPEWLPRRARNHCSFDVTHGRYYCSNHCGLDYQFYFCSPASFGCCHPGFGYCGWDGLLRCAP